MNALSSFVPHLVAGPLQQCDDCCKGLTAKGKVTISKDLELNSRSTHYLSVLGQVGCLLRP